MAVEPTGERSVALYDSTTGLPVRCEVFESLEQAVDFLKWLALEPREPVQDWAHGVNAYADPRAYDQKTLEKLRNEWWAVRVDYVTGDVRDG